MITSIVESMYSSLSDTMKNPNFFQHSAILTSKNTIGDLINEYMLTLILCKEKVYFSHDSLYSYSSDMDEFDDIYISKN